MSDRTSESTSGDSSEERAAMAALMDEVLPVLVTRLRTSRLGELEVSTDGWRVRLRREIPAQTPGMSRGGVVSADSDIGEPAASDATVVEARSPAVGYFTPGRDLGVGQSVRRGDSLGTVEVLGIVGDVPAPSDGVVSRVLAEAGQAVEYGQALADIDPLGARASADGEAVTD